MPKNLLIVESPAKAKTIEKFLGKDFTVKSCYGHIRDLPKGKVGVDTEKGYEPTYEIPKDKQDIVKELKKIAKDAEEIWLATDEDREGEAISWHLCSILGLKPESTKRIVFHEITKNAIQKAIQNPRFINQDLVNAQQARRILDRLVGFEISPILWRKMSMKGSLSAGRVQSVALRLIVEREKEIMDFEATSAYRVVAEFTVKGKDGKTGVLKAELPQRFDEKADAQKFLEKCSGAKYNIDDIQVKPAKKSPAMPFTTSTLQQEASRKLGFSVGRTMQVAQKLYEAGHITYMRTDSVNLSETAMDAAAQEINSSYGKEYHQPRQYKTKSASAQEAHEAIRPTYMNERDSGATRDEKRLYELIWKRTLASQMSDAQLERTTVQIGISSTQEKLVAKGEVVKFEGFLKVYFESSDDEEEGAETEGMLPPMTVGQDLGLKEMVATERFTRAAPRYTEASLVKKLEELGIGRPSTYAPTISTIQKRNYVVKEDRPGTPRKYDVITLKNEKITEKKDEEITGAEKSKMFPTDAGILVNDFLTDHFKKIMDYNFTARIEKEFDEIAEGKKEWNEMIDAFYKPFHKNVEETTETAERVTGERPLGDDPKTGKPIIVRMGKYGPMVQMGHPDDEQKPKYAKLRPTMNIATVTLEEALELFKLPRTVGEFEGSEVVASEGRFGPYVMHEKKFYSLKKGEQDPLDITIDEAIELIKDKRIKEANKYIQTFEEEDIQVLRGPYGPYIKKGKTNYKIPKGTEPEKLTLEEIKEIIEKAPEKKGRGRGGAKAGGKSTDNSASKAKGKAKGKKK